MILLLFSILALAWANSPWSASYEATLHFTFAGLTLHHWINDGLMSLFFLLVGLEIRHELHNGELSTPRKAMLPIFAALGGMVVPAFFYWILNRQAPASQGWGIPMATDIAFAIAVLSALGNRVPKSLKVFLTALAIVDDIGAIAVIAIFYTSEIFAAYLGYGALVAAGIFGSALAKAKSYLLYTALGIALWFCFLRSGIHPTLAGVIFAMLIPADLGEFFEQKLKRAVDLIVLPLFALANAGVAFSTSGITSSISLGVIAGLVLGKPIGITAFSWISVKSGTATLPVELKWSKIFGAACLGGIGFTVSLFIAQLAFTDASLVNDARLGIIVASVVSVIAGTLILQTKNFGST